MEMGESNAGVDVDILGNGNGDMTDIDVLSARLASDGPDDSASSLSHRSRGTDELKA